MGIQDLGAAPWHKAMPTPIPSQHEMLKLMKPAYYASIKTGRLRPPTVPWQIVSFFLLGGFLIIDHRERYWLYQCRWLVFATICYIEYGHMTSYSSIEPASGYMTGLIAAWTVIWSSVWLVWTRPQFTARRVERRRKTDQGKRENSERSKPVLDARGRRQSFVASGWELDDKKSSGNLMHNLENGGETTETTSDADQTDVNGARKKIQHKTIGKLLRGKDISDNIEDMRQFQAKQLAIARSRLARMAADESEWEYFYQPYPSSILSRIGWVTDLILSFRGQGWNFSIPSNPSLPSEIAESLGEPVTKTLTSKAGVKRFASRRELAKYQLPKFLLLAILLDFLKLNVLYDPYFRTGDLTLPVPFYLAWLPPFGQLFMRRIFLLTGVITAIEFVELLSPLVFCLLVGPTGILGLRGESWHYPTSWGGTDIILSKGLNGLWGGWWHQTFRIGFAAPSNYLIRHHWISRKSFAGQIGALLIAFTISGSLHLCGSLSQLPQTNPLGPMQFFLLQVPGILIQTLFSATFSKQITRLPSSIRRFGNGLFCFCWLFLTCSSFVDDMTRGGVWMFEPLPWSPLRALGLGPHGEGMWPWENIHGAYWESPKGKWWESGWALFL